MKILAIIGASKNGNTTEIVKFFEKQLKNNDNSIDFEYLYLSDYPINFCVGCHNCIFVGENKCPEYSKVKVIEDKMLLADGIVLATPGYMFSMSGIMKNFLDHVAYNCHRPKYFGKKAFILASATKWQAKGIFIPTKTWASGAGFEVSGTTYAEMAPFPLKTKEIEKIKSKLSKSALKFHKELTNKKELKPDMGSIAVFYIFRTFCKIMPNILKADYAYFNEKNAYDSKTKWFTKAKISNLKLIMAKFMENQVKKSISKVIDMDKLKEVNGGYKNKLI